MWANPCHEKLQLDMSHALCLLQAGYAGSVITGGVAILDALLHKSPAAGYSPKGYYPDHDKSYYPEHEQV